MCEQNLKCIFLTVLEKKFWLPKWKLLAIIQEIICCRPCACLHHQKFCLCKHSHWQHDGEKEDRQVSKKEQRWVNKGLCEMLNHNFCWISLSIWLVIWCAQPSTYLIWISQAWYKTQINNLKCLPVSSSARATPLDHSQGCDLCLVMCILQQEPPSRVWSSQVTHQGC